MKTEILGEEQLDVVVDLLLRQEIVAIPTETVYGLAGDATSDEACKQIFRIKGRAMDNPLISHFAHRDQLANYDIALSPSPRACSMPLAPVLSPLFYRMRVEYLATLRQISPRLRYVFRRILWRIGCCWRWIGRWLRPRQIFQADIAQQAPRWSTISFRD